MNRIYILLISALCCRPAAAQTYLQLNIGGHGAKQVMSDPQYDHFGFGTGYSAGISGGIIKGKWQFDVGLKYLTQKFSKQLTLRFEDQLDPVTGELHEVPIDLRTEEKYSHIFLPLKAAYKVVDGGRFSIAPFLSVAASCNYSHKQRVTPATSFMGDGHWRESGYIGNPLVRFSVWGGAGAEAVIKINGRIGIAAGPEAWYMINSFSGDSPVKQRTLTLGLNAAVRYRL